MFDRWLVDRSSKADRDRWADLLADDRALAILAPSVLGVVSHQGAIVGG